MVYAVIKDGENVEIVGEEDYSSEKKEKDLHTLIEKNPYIISKEITENKTKTLGSKIKLPSGGELDLLLIDSEGNIILVELKRDKGHREAIAQLLDYASELQTMSVEDLFKRTGIKFKSLKNVHKLFENEVFGEELSYKKFEENVRRCLSNPEKLQLLLVAYRIGEDTLRVVNWLRKFGVNIRCIEFEYFRKENKEIFVPRIIEVSEVMREKEEENEPTSTQKKYQKFFTEILSKFKAKKPGVTEKSAPYNDVLTIPSGHTDFYFEWYFIGKEKAKSFGIALVFDSRDEKENEKLMKYFDSRKEEIEQKIGEKISPFSKGKLRALYTERKVGPLDNALADEKLKQWAVDTMIKFYDTLKPLLDEVVRQIRR